MRKLENKLYFPEVWTDEGSWLHGNDWILQGESISLPFPNHEVVCATSSHGIGMNSMNSGLLIRPLLKRISRLSDPGQDCIDFEEIKVLKLGHFQGSFEERWKAFTGLLIVYAFVIGYFFVAIVVTILIRREVV